LITRANKEMGDTGQILKKCQIEGDKYKDHQEDAKEIGDIVA
jgi:hypothetical protein